MAHDSRPVVRPLAEAMLEWTDPDLLDAVRTAEAACGPAELETRGRDRIETFATPRGSGRPGQRPSGSGLPEAVAAVDRAWEAVFEAFRVKVELGEISLRGRMVRPERRTQAQPIPSVWGPELVFDARGATVTVRDQVFATVTAARIWSRDPGIAASEGAGPASEEVEHLSMLQAVIRWCDQRRVARVRDEERERTAFELHQFAMPKLTHESEWSQPSSMSWAAETNFLLLTAAWDELLRDFRARIEQGELYLEGVLSSDDPHTEPEAIPNRWAAELTFDLGANVVERNAAKYLAVTVSKTPSPWTAVQHPGPAAARTPSQHPLTGEAMRALTDDEVLDLLEENARRVVEHDARLLKPGRIVLTPIIHRKMVHRASTGMLEEQLTDEAAFLARWIADRLPSHHTPQAGTIENTLRKQYAALKARSKATKP